MTKKEKQLGQSFHIFLPAEKSTLARTTKSDLVLSVAEKETTRRKAGWQEENDDNPIKSRVERLSDSIRGRSLLPVFDNSPRSRFIGCSLTRDASEKTGTPEVTVGRKGERNYRWISRRREVRVESRLTFSRLILRLSAPFEADSVTGSRDSREKSMPEGRPR